jgi:hypothetical protein
MLFLHNGGTNLHSQQQCPRVSFSPPLHQQLSVDFLIITPNRCNVIFHCGFGLHFLITSDARYICIHLVTICEFSLGPWYFFKLLSPLWVQYWIGFIMLSSYTYIHIYSDSISLHYICLCMTDIHPLHPPGPSLPTPPRIFPEVLL